MSWSVIAAQDENKCCICGEPLKDTDPYEGAVAFINCGVMTDERAREFSNQDGWTPCSLLVGYDYKEQYLGHAKCLKDAIVDATAERLRKDYGKTETHV